MIFATAPLLAETGYGGGHTVAFAAPMALSQRLRTETASLHHDVEQAAGLPDCVANLDDYAACLTRFWHLFAPLEAALATWDQWDTAGINLRSHCRCAALLDDLRHLGRPPAAVPADVPPPPSFAAALGCLYVLEGSTLGGKFLLRAFAQRLGPAIHGATAFFAGHGAAPGAGWNQFRAALDDYGATQPSQQNAVLDGAAATFRQFAARLKAPAAHPA